MKEAILIQNLIDMKQKGFITVVDRSKDYPVGMTHIYTGSFNDPGEPMCRYAPYSFWRNNYTSKFCKICIKNTLKILTNYE